MSSEGIEQGFADLLDSFEAVQRQHRVVGADGPGPSATFQQLLILATRGEEGEITSDPDDWRLARSAAVVARLLALAAVRAVAFVRRHREDTGLRAYVRLYCRNVRV